jgi:hypothetical protein
VIVTKAVMELELVETEPCDLEQVQGKMQNEAANSRFGMKAIQARCLI